MISQCPHCQKDLSFNEVQKQKIELALSSLKTGSLKLGCPSCKQPIHLRADGSLIDQEGDVEPGVSNLIKPPSYPDISWMANGICDEQEMLEEVPKALILMPEGAIRDSVTHSFVELGYQTTFPESVGDAREHMRFVNFTAVVYYGAMEGELADSSFHSYMSQMPMSRRRTVYYVLVGPKFHTLYDLEALAYSANVVVNEAEVGHFDIILKKGMSDYDGLFGPYAAARAVH